MNTTALTPSTVAAALSVPNSAFLDTIDPADAWAALWGIARARADEWDKIARNTDAPAAVAMAQAYDRLASTCMAQQREHTAPAPAEDMDHRLSSL